MDQKPIHKTFEIKILEKRKDGGRIAINTASLDRDRDRVMPAGARVDNYQRNPVVQWGHNYRDPWATVGKSNTLELSADAIVADFDLRPAVNDYDPQNIVLLLWNGGWVQTASIGFIPKAGKPNAEGGTDFTEWELLEWSIVPIPSNQDAVRLAVKGFGSESADDIWANAMLDIVTQPNLTDPERHRILEDIERVRLKFTGQPVTKDSEGDPGRAWIRRLTVESGIGKQTIYAAFRKHSVDVPKDAMLLQFDFTLGECNEVPHPEAGKTVAYKDVAFIPPLEYSNSDFGKDAVYAISRRDQSDDDIVKAPRDQWDVVELSDIVDSLPVEKAFMGFAPGFGIDVLTQRSIEEAGRLAHKHQAALKRGRVLSAKNEGKIRQARDNLDEVLAELEKPEAEDEGKTLPAAVAAAHLLDADGERDLAESMRTLLNTVKGEFKK